MTTPHQAADELAEAIRGLFICEADLREHRDIPGRFDCAFCPAHDGKDDDGRWFNRRHPIHTRRPGSPMPCPWSTARDALTRYDAARAVPTTPLPEPWSWCKDRPENVECGGCGFEMYGGHVDTSPNPTGNNACPVCDTSALGSGEDVRAAVAWWRLCVEQSEWRRELDEVTGIERTYLSVRLADGADLSCQGTTDMAMRAALGAHHA